MNKHLFLATAIATALMLSTIAPVYAVVEEPTPMYTATPTVSPTPKPTQNRIRATVEALKAERLQKARTMAVQIFNNQFLKRLTETRTRIQANTKLGADAKAVIIAKIDAELNWFTAKRDSIANASTIESVRAIVKEARTRFFTIAKEIRRLHYANGFVVRLEAIITNMETKLFPRIDTRIATLKSKGVNTETAEQALASAKAEVTKAKALLPEIRNSTTLEVAKEKFDQAKANLKKSREYLKQMVQALKASLPKPTVTTTVAPTT